MRILFITGLYPLQDNPMSAIFLTRRLKKLKESGLDYDLFFFSEQAGLPARFLKNRLKRPSFKGKSPVEVEGILYKPLPVSLGILDMINYHRRIGAILVKAVKEKINLAKYDLIHAHWVYPHGYITSLLKQEVGKPCVISAHGSDIHTNPFKNPQSIPSILFALESADRVIFNNRKLLDTARDLGYSGGNSTVIYNGIELDKFMPMDKEKVRKSLGLPSHTTRLVGFIGNLKPVKRADMLPEIFKEIAKTCENIKFVVVGDGKLRKGIERKCQQHNLPVIFAGRVGAHEVATWMNALDVLVLPSRNEGFPNVCLEAQACGCPVAGSNVGGIPEAIGDGGVVVEDRDDSFVKEFSRAVIELLDNPPPKEQLRKRALLFDWNLIIKKQMQVYDDLFKKGMV